MRGYLIFTTYEASVVCATFLPETPENTSLFDKLRTCKPDDKLDANDKAARIWSEYEFAPEWRVESKEQLNCQPWPYGDKEIIGSFYISII